MDEARKVATDELTLAVNRLWEDRTHADLTISCPPRQWKVHKAILCSRSNFFKAACQPGRFKESTNDYIELHSKLEVPDLPAMATREYDDPDAINVLIYHLYHPISDYTTLSGDAGMELVLHAWVFAAAEKYDLKVVEAMGAVYQGTVEMVTELRECMSSALLKNQGQLLIVPTIRQPIEAIDGLTWEEQFSGYDESYMDLRMQIFEGDGRLRFILGLGIPWLIAEERPGCLLNPNTTNGSGGSITINHYHHVAASGRKCPVCGGPHRARDCPRKKKKEKKEREEKVKVKVKEEEKEKVDGVAKISSSAARRLRQKKNMEERVRAEAALQHSALEASNAELRQRMTQLADEQTGLPQ
ncbi:hypothetical protein KC340_g18144 [Hortaea werneckii]|nr:hypothetical protein KC340_g18144 [Hortaea werneckii]KAI7371502.1 hypothetical protein KC328_g17528 [Hortaea werneckii]